MPTVLITGANRGIGLAFARGYASDGWRVHACCRVPERAGDLKEVAGDIEIHRCDVTGKTQVASLARVYSAPTPGRMILSTASNRSGELTARATILSRS